MIPFSDIIYMSFSVDFQFHYSFIPLKTHIPKHRKIGGFFIVPVGIMGIMRFGNNEGIMTGILKI